MDTALLATPILEPPTLDTSLMPDQESEAVLPPDTPCRWPRDILEAYARDPGPYTLDNAEALLENEPLELYNGWLVWQEMTHLDERRVVATIQDMLSLSARKLGYGQALPDQVECVLQNGDVVKPDASLVSWARLRTAAHPAGPSQRSLLHGGPELVAEARSPSNRRAQERRKRALYFANNVEMVWDVDETHQTIWVYRASAPDQPVRYGIDDTIDCEPLLPGWRRRVADIFAAQASAEAVAGEVAQAWREEGRAEGREEGQAEGRTAGLAEGAALTLRQVLPLLLQARYGAVLPADLPERLAGCDLAQLQALQSATATCTTLEDWLTHLPA